MLILRDPKSLDRALAAFRRRGKSIGFVPTMGALHEGHAALIRESLRRRLRTVVSIYVNPLQFESAAELRRYPRSFQKDIALLRRLNVDAVYCPAAKSFPAAAGIRMTEQRVSRLYEGKLRPGHFEGVLSIVAKLLLQVRPAVAFFGEKDFQQLWLVQQMLEEYPMGVRLVAVPTVREPSGLAVSSRNSFLTRAGRAKGAEIFRALSAAKKMSRAGCRPAALESFARRHLRSAGIRPQYVSLIDTRDFSSPRAPLKRGGSYRLLAAARIDGVHLIDNVAVLRSPQKRKRGPGAAE